MEMSHILITLCFGSISTEIENIDTERAIRNEISNILGKYYKAGNICNFVVADDEVISEKLKASQPCDDCISREEALVILDDFYEDIENGQILAYPNARVKMSYLPSVQPTKACPNCGEEMIRRNK